MTPSPAEVSEAVEAVFRHEWSRIIGGLVRLTGSLDVAEESVQEAFAIAVRTWPATGVPRRPAAWITTAARRRAIDRLRAASTAQRTAARVGALQALEALQNADAEADVDSDPVSDDQLRLVFLCCHPALALDAQVALTLRVVAGLSTASIARAFLVPETTMAQRLVRAKRKVEAAHIPFALPAPALLADRLDAALAVVYLVFNEGYSATEGDALVRRQLCDEAIRLGRLLLDLLPDEPEVRGLLALMLLHHSRRDTRIDANGAQAPLEEQDRGRWDRDAIAEGLALVQQALGQGRPGPLQVQASIAALHAEASAMDATDWCQIAALYDVLAHRWPSPVVALNRAVAIGMSDGVEVGLAAARQARSRARRLPPSACRPRRPVAPRRGACPRRSPSTTGRSQARALSPSGRTSNDVAERYGPASADAGPLLGIVLGEMVDDATIDGVDEDEAAPRRWFLGRVQEDPPGRPAPQPSPAELC